MNKQEIMKFISMVMLYDQVGEVTLTEQVVIDSVVTLAEHNELTAIESLYNEEEYEKAEDLYSEHFSGSLKSLNELADEFGYQRIGS